MLPAVVDLHPLLLLPLPPSESIGIALARHRSLRHRPPLPRGDIIDPREITTDQTNSEIRRNGIKPIADCRFCCQART